MNQNISTVFDTFSTFDMQYFLQDFKNVILRF